MKFDISKLSGNAVSLCIGPRSTGKTTFVLKAMKYLPKCQMVISSSEHERDKYSGIPFYTEFDEDIVSEFALSRRAPEPPEPACIILDGCIDRWMDSPSMKDLILNGQKTNTSVFITMAYAQHLEPELRNNVSYVFLTRETNEGNLRRIHEQYGEVFKDVVTQANTMIVLESGKSSWSTLD